jgi:hypothetical protein
LNPRRACTLDGFEIASKQAICRDSCRCVPASSPVRRDPLARVDQRFVVYCGTDWLLHPGATGPEPSTSGVTTAQPATTGYDPESPARAGISSTREPAETGYNRLAPGIACVACVRSEVVSTSTTALLRRIRSAKASTSSTVGARERKRALTTAPTTVRLHLSLPARTTSGAFTCPRNRRRARCRPRCVGRRSAPRDPPGQLRRSERRLDLREQHRAARVRAGRRRV